MYVAGTPPQDPAMLPGFLLSELRKLQEAMSTEANMLLLETHLEEHTSSALS